MHKKIAVARRLLYVFYQVVKIVIEKAEFFYLLDDS